MRTNGRRNGELLDRSDQELCYKRSFVPEKGLSRGRETKGYLHRGHSQQWYRALRIGIAMQRVRKSGAVHRTTSAFEYAPEANRNDPRYAHQCPGTAVDRSYFPDGAGGGYRKS